ncbi:hypothetical protein V7S43_015930 [Phytophthora oleae]|uniref:protein-tyrosine-phosphatase n=1 Tax=Phytophthora oleae TaxID=2107226 RepID=A0ABD3EXM8_9STRA
MAEDGDLSTRPRRSHLTPLLSSQLQLSTPPCSSATRQNTTQNSDRPAKRVSTRSRPPHSRRRRAIFDVENDQHMEEATVENPQITSNVAQEQQPRSDQDRKRAATADGVQLSPRSMLTEQKMHQKKSKTGGPKSELEVEATTVLKRAMSSYAVTSGSLSPAPVLPPRLLRHHASEQSISVKNGSLLSKTLLSTVYSSKHPDLNVITPETVLKVQRGDFKDQLVDFRLLDCRFPFETEGGTLKGASSLCDPDRMEAQLFEVSALENCTRTALIFFCEFSANRAPKMLRHVRNVDRRLHADSYPELYYPELYLIDGGYKHCFETLQHEICAPSALYVTMEDERFVEECRREFAAWRRRWKPHKNVAHCAAKLEESPSLNRHQHQVRPLAATSVRSLFDEL